MSPAQRRSHVRAYIRSFGSSAASQTATLHAGDVACHPSYTRPQSATPLLVRAWVANCVAQIQARPVCLPSGISRLSPEFKQQHEPRRGWSGAIRRCHTTHTTLHPIR
eukprot:364795-Chlamydomonas_euryale.AAC.9